MASVRRGNCQAGQGRAFLFCIRAHGSYNNECFPDKAHSSSGQIGKGNWGMAGGEPVAEAAKGKRRSRR